MPTSLWRRPNGSYRNLTMRCAPGTHEAVMEILHQLSIKPGPALDLASGSGALLARLSDTGFTDLSAVELDAAKFGLSGISPMAVDLNTEFAEKIGRRFSLITAIEIVEHLNSPRHFLTQIRQLLTDDGVLILSTPNIADWLGRIKFLLTGTLRYFDEAQYRFNHHVSPLPDAQLRHLAGEIGLRVVRSTTAGGFFGPLKSACLLPIWLPFRAAFGPAAVGEVNLYALARTNPRAVHTGDWTAESTPPPIL